LLSFLLILMLGCYQVVSFFRLGSDTRALKDSCASAMGGDCHKRIVFNAGWLSTSILRAVTHFVNLPADARTALSAVHGAEVGIYRQQGAPPSVCFPAVLQSADKAMLARGWERVVGVVHEHEMVVVYTPGRGLSSRRMKCCVMVLHKDDLIIVGARGNLEPLQSIAQNRIHFRNGDVALREANQVTRN
jgi:hypothetical protein